MKILVVDDHPENVLALRAVLTDPDYEILDASSGDAALKLVLKHDFAVILMDVVMPDMDGFEVARIIRQREASKHVPILFLTAALPDVAAIYRGYSVGAVDYMVKPLDPDIVRAKVAVFVDLFRKERRLREAERRLGKEALQASEALYEATFDRAPVGIAHADLEGRWLRINRKLREMGDSERSIPSQDVLQSLLSSAIEEHREEKRHRRGAATFWTSEVWTVLRDAAGNPKHFIVVVEDVTAHRMSEERERFLAAAGNTLLSSFDCSATLSEVARLAASTIAEGCIVHLAGDELIAELLCVSHVRPEEEAELLRLWRSGEPDPRLSVAPLVSRQRVLGQIVLLSGDRSIAGDLAQLGALAVDNARLYRESQNAIGARDEFLSIASHELRTPLTPLQILFQRLLGDGSSPPSARPEEQLQAALVRGDRQVQRLSALVDKLLDVSSLAGGQVQLQRDRCDLVAITLEVLARLGEELGRAQCEVELNAPEPVLGCWDGLRVEQVISNLVSNALKYGAGRPISIAVEVHEDHAVFRIRDQGVGIEPDKLPRIFGRFERAVSSRSYGGLGLGLYIARQLIDAHGGKISVDSRPGEGALFTIALPIELPTELPAL